MNTSRRDFFKQLGITAVTFSDVGLCTGFSEVAPANVDVATMFSRRIGLRIPLVSAGMDRVTEHELAISLAILGGIGVLHRGMSTEKQAKQAARVKHAMNGLVEHPICVKPSQTIGEVTQMRDEKRFKFESFPVTEGEDGQGKLLGVLTGNDFRFYRNEPDTLIVNAMTDTPITAPADTTVHDAYKLMCKTKKKVLPLVDGKGNLAGLYIFSDVERIATGSSETHNTDSHGRLRVAAAIGTGPSELERAAYLAQENVDALVIDTAHADSRPVFDILKCLKGDSSFDDIDIVVGNISEPESAARLAKAGADGIKVGQGPGSICTTRIVSGVGCPQITAINNCAEAVAEFGTIIIADGGIEHSGDIPKAIGAGAHCVMIGGLFAGAKQSPGEIILYHGVQCKDYRGMGSESAMRELASSRDRYRVGGDKLVPEGIDDALVPYKGDLAEIVFLLIGGLRSGMGYVGAASISELREKATFRLISLGGQSESHVHGVTMTKDAPNYTQQ